MSQQNTNQELLGVSTSLLTVFALAATSKIWVVSLPVLLVLDVIEEFSA